MINYFNTLLIMLAFFCPIIAQENDTIVKIPGDDELYTAGLLIKENKLDSAKIFIKKAADLYGQNERYYDQVNALNTITILDYNYLKDYISYQHSAKAAFEIAEKHIKHNDPRYIRAEEQVSAAYYSIGDYANASKVALKAIQKKEKSETNKIELATSYLNLANYFKFSSEYNYALDYIRKAYKTQKDTSYRGMEGHIFNNMGRVFQLQDNMDSTIVYLEKAKRSYELYKPTKTKIRRKVNNLLLLAEVYSERGELKKANELLNSTNILSLTEDQTISYHESKGKILSNQKDYSKAITNYLIADSLSNTFNKKNSPPFKARRHFNLGEIQSKMGQYEEAILQFHNGIQMLSTDSLPDDSFLLPDIDNLLDKQDALKLLHEKARSHYGLYSTSENQKQLTAAHKTYLLAATLIKSLRSNIHTIDSKNILAERALSIYEEAIEVCIQLYTKTKNASYKEEAFLLSEANKAQLLLESLRDQNAKLKTGITENLLSTDRELNIRLSFLKNQLLEKKKSGKTTKGIEDQILKLNEEIINHASALEEAFPKYVELKNTNNTIALASIRKHLLDSNTALLGYFMGERNSYVFAIQENDIQISSIGDSKILSDRIGELKQLLENPRTGKEAINDFDQFVEISYSIYNSIINTAEQDLSDGVDKLIIIPDGSINYLPFDILISNKEPNQGRGFSKNNLDYLIEKYAISYTYSATLLENLDSKQNQHDNNFIGYAPTFEDTLTLVNPFSSREGLQALKCADLEIKSISELTNGSSILGDHATKSSFESLVSNSKIIHLATHASIDIKNPDHNKIFLSDSYISNLDLYNYRLNAELAVLSGCNTGSGQLIKGEGVMSLAKGFFNAGCLSTLMSLWQVDDCATSDIMVDFYKGLNSGKDKDEALRNAKLTYLNQARKSKQHPYYWAAFVPYGNMDSIKITESIFDNKWFLLGGFGICTILFLFFFYRRK